jgi:hypothetical protein
MMLDWTTLALLCFAAAVAWFWQDSLAAREVANAAANEACERLALQFLDGTVAFARVHFGRGMNGRLVLRRTYVFDYTANSIERRQGFIVVTARQVETIGYAQDEARREPMLPAKPTPQDEAARIVRLDDFRERPDQRPSQTQSDEKLALRRPPSD